MKTQQEIHDMIQCFQLSADAPAGMASRILDILAAMNERLNGIECDAKYALEAVGRLASKPD